jgi:hypothetical protein
MRPVAAMAFVDWNAQIHNAGARDIADARRRAHRTLDVTLDLIARALNTVDRSGRYKVSLRLYHGWHRGLTPSENRLALSRILNDPDFRLVSPSLNVLFETPIMFGDLLLAALPHRMLRSPRIHLPDTFRAPMTKGGPLREKMVDTAMASDLLVQARSEPLEWRIVLAEDDDLVPALFVAEAWSKDKGGRTMLIMRRPASRFLRLDGLAREIAQ